VIKNSPRLILSLALSANTWKQSIVPVSGSVLARERLHKPRQCLTWSMVLARQALARL